MAQSPFASGSYSLGGSGGAAQQSNVGVQLGQSGMSGGQVFRADAQQRVEIDTSTSDLLMQLGSKIIEPQIQKIQTEKFLEGAQRVAQGDALKDIVDEQPWFTQIFGPSSSTQGARAVAQMKGVDDYLTSVANEMPELRKLSSEEFGKQITNKMGDFLTGDSVADAAIQMKMVESTGSLFKAHTKANYKYTQDTMQQNISGYMRSGGAKLQALSANLLDGTMSKSDYEAAQAEYVGNLLPLEGQSPESYWAAIEESTIDALANSNHHAANAIFDSGVFNSAPAEMRKKMLDARHKYEAQTQEVAGFDVYGPRIGQLKGMAAAGQLTGNQILSEVDKINADYSARYGINRPLFKRKEFESILSGNISSIYNRAEQDRRDLAREGRADARADAKERAKAETDLRKSQQLTGLIQMGAGNMAGLAGYSADEINNAVFTGAQVIAAKGGNVGEYLVNQYNNGGEHVNPLYKNKLQAGMRAAKQEGHSGKAFETSYGMYKQLSQTSGGKGAAMAYLGDDAVRMMKYDQFVQNKLAPEVAYQLSFGEALDNSRKSSDKDIQKQLVKTVENAEPGMFGKLFGDSMSLTEQSKRVLTTAVGQNYDKLATNAALDDDQAMKIALNVAKGELDVVGPYVYQKGTDRKPVYQMIGADEKTAGRVFAQFINNRAKENGMTNTLPGEESDGLVGGIYKFGQESKQIGTIPAVGRWGDRVFGSEPNVMVMRLPDQEGVGMFGITVVDIDGTTRSFPVTTNEVRDFYEKSKKFKK
ncbi:internal virion protein [Pseudomonas phage VSW-3]|uniref:Internal virion protein n=1 Tax=Pseudomonas phage VSW-3 TaxID=1852562 RepID=A0A173GCM2_9CAUD|nr:internal virion protein [Pseudomonas phage VSW-3]ANH51101.1 hypothetical protein VSW3_25 [Pseudomonas phage VSW-3]